MKKAISTLLLAGTALTFAACEAPPPKEKTPEHLQCLERAEAYLNCTEKEAAGLDEMTAKPIKRAVEANRRKAGISLEKCESVLSKAEGSCAP